MSDVKELNPQDLTYSIVITNVIPEKIDSISKEFADVFSLDLSSAEQILKGYPIIFAEKLPRNDIRTLKSKLMELSKSGIEFTITTEVSNVMPKVIWATPFNYVEGKANTLLKSIRFQWAGSAFSCPACGETFVFQRIGNPFVGKPMPCTEIKSDNKELSSEQKTQPRITVKNETESEEIIELAPIEEEILEPTPEILEPEPEILEPEPENTEEILEVIEEVSEAPEIIEEPANEETVMEPSVDMSLQDIRAYPSSKRENAAKIISEISNKTIEETRKLLSRSSSPLINNIPEAQATIGLEQLKKIGISEKIYKAKV